MRSSGRDGEVLIAGPNAVIEALRAARPVSKVLLREGRRDGVARRVGELAAKRGVPVVGVPSEELTRLLGSADHQGVVAVASPREYVELEDLIGGAREAAEPEGQPQPQPRLQAQTQPQPQSRRRSPLVFVVDGVTDPRNLGAIIRVAGAVGSDGVVIPRRRAAQLTAAVAKTSAGAVERVPIARVSNIAAALETLKQKGLWVLGADAASGMRFWDADLTVPLAIVLGGEDRGLAPLVARRCDLTVAVPMAGGINSLNVSVAAAVIAYEALRQRSASGEPLGPDGDHA